MEGCGEQTFIGAYLERLHVSSFVYRNRDGLPPPTLDTLRLLTERHLRYIPFENLSMHLRQRPAQPQAQKNDATSTSQPASADSSPVVLDRAALIDKILNEKRGGCCLELNGLFAWLLQALGYPIVRLVPCWVHAGQERGHASKRAKFRTIPSHFVLLVQVAEEGKFNNQGVNNGYNSDTGCFIVDVGLGEPPLWPLSYGASHLDQAQFTPEGMRSRIRWDPRGPWVDGKGNVRRCLIQEWWREAKGEWEPRLQWDVKDAPLDVASVRECKTSSTDGDGKIHTLDSFRYVVPILTDQKSSFARKTIVCILTRREKITFSGRTLKLTEPRFGPESIQSTTELESEAQVLQVLENEFGIVLPEGDELDFTVSDAFSESRLWDHL